MLKEMANSGTRTDSEKERGIRLDREPEWQSSWLDSVRRKMIEKGLTQVGLMRLMHLKRGQEWSKSAVSRLVKEGIVTDVLARDVCAVLKLRYPVSMAGSDAEAEWFEIGRNLSRISPKDFYEALADVREVLEATGQKLDALGRIRNRAKNRKKPT